MPAAAPAPRRNAVGSDQNGGVALYNPTAPTHSAASASAADPVNELAASPAAADHRAVCGDVPSALARPNPVRGTP